MSNNDSWEQLAALELAADQCSQSSSSDESFVEMESEFTDDGITEDIAAGKRLLVSSPVLLPQY